MDTSSQEMINAYACARTHANPATYIELILPLWHQDTKKGEKRCYVPRESVRSLGLLIRLLGLCLITFRLFLNVIVFSLRVFISFFTSSSMSVRRTRGSCWN